MTTKPRPQFVEGTDNALIVAVCLGLALAGAISLAALVVGWR